MTIAKVSAPRGTTLNCLGWQQEAPYRMLQNNLDPEVAENPDELVVYGGTGRAARSWDAFHAMKRTLTTLKADETMLVQSGKPVGVMRTHEWAPRVLIANSNLVPDWANWDEFRRLEHMGLTMYGQMTAGSWIYIGTQGILQGTYECFAEIARRKFGGTLAGTLTITAGAGGMGGAQPLAVTMNDGVVLIIDVDQHMLQRRVDHRYLDEIAPDYDSAVRTVMEAKAARRPLSVGLLGNAADVLPRLLADNVDADIVTDQTSAHDPLSYMPNDLSLEAAAEMRRTQPDEFIRRSRAAMAAHCEAMVGFMDAGVEVFDYGNSLRAEAQLGGYDRAFDYPGFLPAYIRPLFCEGKGPFRWVALSGDPADIAATDKAVLEEFPDDEGLARWIKMAGERVAFQGLPGPHLLARLRRTPSARDALQRDGAVGRAEGTDRDRSRSPRLGFGRLAVPRNRGHARRLGRDRRLAAAERHGQRLLGSHLGQHPPRWWGRDRALDPRRPGVCRRRHRPGRPEARASAHQRSGDGRDPPRRRRLRTSDRGRRRTRRSSPDDRRPVMTTTARSRRVDGRRGDRR